MAVDGDDDDEEAFRRIAHPPPELPGPVRRNSGEILIGHARRSLRNWNTDKLREIVVAASVTDKEVPLHMRIAIRAALRETYQLGYSDGSADRELTPTEALPLIVPPAVPSPPLEPAPTILTSPATHPTKAMAIEEILALRKKSGED